MFTRMKSTMLLNRLVKRCQKESREHIILMLDETDKEKVAIHVGGTQSTIIQMIAGLNKNAEKATGLTYTEIMEQFEEEEE